MNMVVIIICFLVFIWIGFTVSFMGFDLREKISWIYGLISFFAGLFWGLSYLAILWKA